MTKQNVMRAVGAYVIPPLTLVDDQVVADIVAYMPVAHKAYTKMYDRMADCLEESDLEGICQELWEFCRENLRYNEETVDDQRLSSPSAMINRGWADCKGYALFCGGMLDALNRRGAGINWCYRFVPSAPLGVSIGHVFVVVEPKGRNIWIDPVLGSFDFHTFFLVHRDVNVWYTPAAVGKVAGLQAMQRGAIPRRVGSAESSLLDMMNEYTLGMVNAVQYSISNGTINTISAAVIQTASAIIPGVSAVLALLGYASTALDNAFGPGSLAARLMTDISSNIITCPVTIVESILNGRTFESDQYYGATYYYYYVMGQSKYLNKPSQVSDAQVPAALKWFIDRLGVFISGREHIEALVQGASQYIALYNVNPYTTTDMTQVAAAVAVAQQYFNFNGAAGSWADTVGVYDQTLVNIANQLGESVEAAAAQEAQGTLPVADQLQIIAADPVVWIAAAGLLLLLFL